VKIEKIINELTLEEKALLLTGAACMNTFGVERLGIPPIFLADGPHGVRADLENNCTSFPNMCCAGASWDVDLMYRMGEAIGRDCLKNNVDIILGPGLNIKRNILCGRNFEYISEDPVVTGEMGAAYINGLQSTGVGTCPKHYAVNNQEKDRGTLSVELDIRTLREIYLKGFEIVVKKSQPASIMCAYNKVHSVWCSENKYLLTKVLRDEWGYDGFVMSDWAAVHNVFRALKAGLDLQMPQNWNIVTEIENGLKANSITMQDIDTAVERIVKFAVSKKEVQSNYDREAQHQIAREAAAAGMVLLKNDNNCLPINSKKYKKIAVIGEFAEEPLIAGQGSAEVYTLPEYIESPLTELKKQLGTEVEIKYRKVYSKQEFSSVMLWHNMDEYRNFIKDCDCVLLFVGSMVSEDTENFDRRSANLNPNYEMFIDEAYRMCKNVAVVIQSGGAMILDAFKDKVSAIIQMWLSGEGAGGAIADILTGKINPSGKLTETFPNRLRLDLADMGDKVKIEYNEKLDVGYRYYDKHTDEICYPFGHGISYTSFSYSNPEVMTDNDTIHISFKLANTGDYDGAEVVQVYTSDPYATYTRPIKELRAFKKIFLKAGETKVVNIDMPIKDLAYYNVLLEDWIVESGEYIIHIAASSQDIRLSKSIYLTDTAPYTMVTENMPMIG